MLTCHAGVLSLATWFVQESLSKNHYKPIEIEFLRQ